MATGLSAQFGIVDEVTHGTYVAPTRFYELVKEGLTMDQARLEAKGIRTGGRVQRSDRWVAGSKTVGGPAEFELGSVGFGLLLKHCFGSVSSALNGGGIATWNHTFTPGDLPVGFTTQVGREDDAGTVNPFSYLGCMVESFDLAAKVDEIGSLKVEINAQDESTSEVLAAASLPSSLELMTFAGASLSVAGAAIDVTEVTLSGSNSLKTDRKKLSAVIRKVPIEAEYREYTGTIDAYFASLTAYNRFVNGTEAALVLLFQAPTVIEAALYPQLEVTCNVRFDGETPTVDGPGEIMQSLPFKCIDTGAGASTAISADYQTTDATP